MVKCLTSSTPSHFALTIFYRRKQVGVLASEHWKHKLPKFNTPEKKLRLNSLLRGSLMSQRLAFSQMVLLSTLKASSVSNEDSIIAKRYWDLS